MAAADKFFVGPALAGRLPDVVRTVDSISLGGGGIKLPFSVSTLVTPGGSGSSLFEATFSGGWVKNQAKQIRFAADTSTTAFAQNPFRSIPFSGNSARRCIVAKRESALQQAGVEYVLVNAEC